MPNLEGKANVTENGVYDLYGSAYPTSSYASLNFERGSSISINGDTATVTMVTQASAYDKLYLGTVSDADSVKDAGAISAEDKSEIASGYKTFTFTIPTKDSTVARFSGTLISHFVEKEAYVSDLSENESQRTFKLYQ